MIKVLERGKKSAAEMEEFVASLRKSQVQDKLFDLLKGNGGDLINCLLLHLDKCKKKCVHFPSVMSDMESDLVSKTIAAVEEYCAQEQGHVKKIEKFSKKIKSKSYCG